MPIVTIHPITSEVRRPSFINCFNDEISTSATEWGGGIPMGWGHSNPLALTMCLEL